MRRRLRQQRRMREALLLDLGALVYELHRHGRREPELLQAKAAELTAVDQEVRGLAEALDADESVLTLVAAGIAGSCDNCGSLLSTDARYCGACGAPSVPAIGGPAPSVASPALSGPAAQEPAVASRPQPRPAPEPTTEAEPQPQPEPEPQPHPEPAPEPDTQAEPQPTPEPATQAPPEPATRPESETGVQRTTEEAGGLEAQPEAQAAQAGADEQPAALEASDPPTSIHEHPYPDEPADLDGASDEPEKDEPIAPWLAEAEASKEERSNG